MSKLNRDELIEAVVNRGLLDKDLYIKLNELVADRLHGVSIPYFNDNKILYLFTEYEKALAVEDELNEDLRKLIDNKEEIKPAVELKKVTYIGKVNRVNNTIDMQKDPVEFISTLDVILTNAKFIGIEKVFIDYKTDEEIVIDLNELIEKLQINAEQPKLIMSEEEKQDIINKNAQVRMRFNPVNILEYENPFSIDKQKGLDLSELLFDDEADNLADLLNGLQYHEIAFVAHQLLNEYIPMAKGMENEGMEKNFQSYLEVVRKFLGKKLVDDLKDGKAFYLILNQVEDGRLVVQMDTNRVIPLLYTDFFQTNNTNPFCLVNNYDTFKQFMNNEKPAGLQISAGPTATIMILSKYIVEHIV